MSWGVKTICFKAAGVSLGGSGVSIGGVRILRGDKHFTNNKIGCLKPPMIVSGAHSGENLIPPEIPTNSLPLKNDGAEKITSVPIK